MSLQQWKQRLSWIFRRGNAENDLDNEIRAHLAIETRERIDAGESPELARAGARKDFGNELLVKETTRRVWQWRWLEEFWRDLAYGVRVLRKNPGFATVAILSLALGIGANSAIFSIVYGVLLRPLPYPDAGRVAMIFIHFSPQNVEHGTMSVADYLDIKTQSHVLEDPALFSNGLWRFDLTGNGRPQQVRGTVVTSSFFSTLQATPLIGRVLRPGEDSPSSARVAILSESLWRNSFGADPGVLGKIIKLEGREHMIIGVMPTSFRLWPATDIWLNMRVVPLNRRGPYPYVAVSRLKPGVTFEQAQADLNAIGARIEKEHDKTYSGLTFPVLPLRDALVGDVRPALLVIFGSVVLVLLIATANVANLFLAKASGREREVAVRRALGAARERIVRQLLTESALLALVGGGAGLGFAYAGLNLLRRWNPGRLPRIDEIQLNLWVLLFTFLVALVAGFLFGLAPALQSSRRELNHALKENARSGSGTVAQHSARSVLIVTEVALSFVLLMGAGLLLRSLVRLQGVKTGFQASPSNIVTMQVSLTNLPTPNIGSVSEDDISRQGSAEYQRLLDDLRRLPGVEAAGISTSLPPDGRWNWDTFQIEGKPWSQEAYPAATCPLVSAGYFHALQIPLLKGRYITDDDTHPVAVISQFFARRYFPGEDPIGKRFKEAGPDINAGNDWVEIVGVVGDVKYMGLNQPPEAVYYQEAKRRFDSRVYLAARTATPASAMASTVERKITSFDPTIVVSQVTTMDQALLDSLAEPRFYSSLLTLFAGLALTLAVVGIYGVISYSVAQRTREIGVRMALGAQRSDVLKLVARQGVLLTATGIGIGLLVSLALTRTLSGLLFSMSPNDPVTLLSACVVLCIVATLAALIPVMRATRIEPQIVLRSE
jgi:putative ABC transport system permease protein